MYVASGILSCSKSTPIFNRQYSCKAVPNADCVTSSFQVSLFNSQVFNQAGSSSLSTSIDQLNRAGDRNIVTVKTVWRTVSDTTHMLLHWMAGFQTRVTENSQPEEETGTSTHYINSDEVFSDIVSGYTQKFLTNPELDDKQRNKLQISCPAFLVTESEGSSPPDPKTNILHPAVSCDQEGRHTYEFKHGKIEDLLVQIREPASPADTGYATGGGDVVKEKMVSNFG